MIPQMNAAADLIYNPNSLSLKLGYAVGDRHALFGAHRYEPAYPMHYMVPETTSWRQGCKLTNAKMIPQMTAATELSHSEDWP